MSQIAPQVSQIAPHPVPRRHRNSPRILLVPISIPIGGGDSLWITWPNRPTEGAGKPPKREACGPPAPRRPAAPRPLRGGSPLLV